MWLKVGDKYIQDPRVYGDGFTIRCDDLDGCRIMIRPMKGWRRKVRACLKSVGLTASFTKTGMVRDTLRFRGDVRIKECLECTLEIKGGTKDLDGACVVMERPLHGLIIGE